MAALALGTVGSVVGGMFGGPIGASIGYLIGSTIGNLIDPPKIEGPRLTDLKLQHSQYGTMIPILYGARRVAGNVIWQTDLEEHKQKSGGKGGPQVTTYTYTASWAVYLCEGPILGIGKMWADLRLINSNGTSSEDLPFVLYYGTETQLPDPTMEAEEGAGLVPGHRGVAYIVFTDVQLGDYGNRIFQLEVDVQATGSPAMVRLSTFTPLGFGQSAVGIQDPLAGAYMDGDQLVSCLYTHDSPASTYQEVRYNIVTGEIIETGPVIDVNNVHGSSGGYFITSPNSNVAFGLMTGAGDYDVSRWYIGGMLGVELIQPPVGTDQFYVVSGRPYKHGDFMYAPGGGPLTDAFIGKWGFRGGADSGGEVAGVPENDYFDLEGGSTIGTVDPATVSLTVSDDGFLYAINPGSGDAEMWKIDPDDMSLVRYWYISGPAGLPDDFASVSNRSSFTVYREMILLSERTGGAEEARLFSINDDDTFTLVDTEASLRVSAGFSPMLNLGGGYVLTIDGVLKIGAVEILGNIVADISDRCGLDAAEYDVSDLPDPVLGYAIAAQMTGKNAIEPLRSAYFFDGAEVDDYALFKHRDHAAVDEIPEDDLGVHSAGSAAPALLEQIRTPDSELPRKVDLVYINVDADYQPSTQYGLRQTARSELDVTLSLPIVFNDNEAKERANAALFSSWIERVRVVFYTSRKWEALVPTDVVTVQGHRIRIVDKQSAVGGVIRFSGLITRAIVFSQTSLVSGVGSGFTPPSPGTSTRAATQLVLLDIPLLSLGDSPYGFYSAGAPTGDGAWGGYTLYKSTDGGTTYKEIGSTDSPAVIGVTSSAVAAFTSASPTYDNSGFTVILGYDDAELTSTNATAIENSQNHFAISATGSIPWKFGYFMTATLTASRTYLVKDIRWEDGSVAAIPAGATFVMLDDVEKGRMVLNIDAPESELNLPFLYKAVTWGKTLASATAQTFTNTGEGANSFGPPVTNLLDTFIGDNASGPAPKKGLVPAPWIGSGAAEAVLMATEDNNGSPSTYWGVPSWGGGGGTDGMVPYYIGAAETFTVPIYKQAPYAMAIINDGFLEVDGFLLWTD